jgi:hypothetical protein
MAQYMLSLQVHLVTFRLIQANSGNLSAYLKSHVNDSNAWQAYFSVSQAKPSDLIWESFQVLPRNVIVECACRFAEETLHLFESKYPNDDRPRKAIEAARACNRPDAAHADAAADADADADAAAAAAAAAAASAAAC